MTSFLQFRPIDLSQHFDICITMRREAFRASFENADEKFDREYGEGSLLYRQWLEEMMAVDAEGFLHLWDGDRIIGQMEMRVRGESPVGYVHLFVLSEEYRSRGLGVLLQQKARDFFAQRGMKTLRLSVSPTNQRALAYYKKHGWRDIGPRPSFPEVHWMEWDFPS